MSAKLRNLAVALLALAALTLSIAVLWTRLHTRSNEGLEKDAVQEATHEPTDLTPLAGAAPESGASGREQLAARRAAGVDAPARDAAPDGLAEVRGRFLLPDGAPARGVEVGLRGAVASQQLVTRHGLPADWRDPEPVFSDDDGRFTLRLDPPLAYQFFVKASLAGYADEDWRPDIAPAQVLDLGETTLMPSGDVLVRVVDGRGEPLALEQVCVTGTSLRAVSSLDKEPTRVLAWSAEADGGYRLVGLPVGAVEVTLLAPRVLLLREPRVVVREGRTTEVLLRYEAPDAGTTGTTPSPDRIRVRCRTEPFHSATVEALRSVRLSRDGALVAEAEALQRGSWNYAFEDLAPGDYTVVIEDPRFERWARSGVEPGTTLRPQLVGSAALVLHVLDDESGQAIEPYSLDVRLDPSRARPGEVPLRTARDPAPAGGLYVGLLPVAQTLSLRAAGYADLELSVKGLAPRETRVVEARLVPGLRLDGRFRWPIADVPIANARVYLLPSGSMPADAPLPDGVVRRAGREQPAFQRAATTDSTGRFAFEAVPPGSYALIGRANDWLAASLDPVVVRVGEPPAELDLRATGAAGLRGRVLAPPGAGFEGLRLDARPLRKLLWPAPSRAGAAAVALDEQGRFTFGNLPPGTLHLWLIGESVRIPYGPASYGWHDSLQLDLGEVRLQAGATLEQLVDARAAWPGSVELAIRENDRPARGVVAQLTPLEGSGPTGLVVTGADGNARIEHLAPGDYALSLHSIEGSWSWDSGTRLHVTSVETLRHSLEFVLASATLTCLYDRTGEPLVEQNIMIWIPGARRFLHSWETDDRGRLQLTLPPGRYLASASVWGTDESKAVEFQWTPAGPAPAEVLLRLP